MTFKGIAAVIWAVLMVGTAAAQSPVAPPAPTQASLVDELTLSPILGQRGLSVFAGGSIQDGRTDQQEWTFDGIVAHTTGARTLVRAELSMDVVHHRTPAAADFTETEDNHLLSALVLHPVAPRLSLVGLAGWRRDAVLGLSHRVAAGGGIALHLLQQPHLNVMVSPVFVGGSEARTHTEYGEAVADAGVIQTLALKLNERVTLEQSFKANVDTSALDDHTVRLDASLTSQIVRRVNVNLYLQMERDAVVPSGLDHLQLKTGVALQLTFAGR